MAAERRGPASHRIVENLEHGAAQIVGTGEGRPEGTQDIAALRAEIDDAVRKANGLVNEINKKWPFARDPEVKLP